MALQFSFYLNKLTGEVFGAREKRKFDKEVLSDNTMFQTLKAHKPVVFVKIDEKGDYIGKVIEYSNISPQILSSLSEEGYGLNENFKPNLDLARKNNVCLHCLKFLDKSKAVNRINLDELRDYFELNRKEFRYYSTIKCDNCNKKTSINQYISGFSNTNQIPNLNEIIIDHVEDIDVQDKIYQEEKVTEIIFGRVYDISAVQDVNNLENHDAIKTLLKYQDYKEVGYIKFKRVNNYFTSKDFVKKYKVKAMIL